MAMSNGAADEPIDLSWLGEFSATGEQLPPPEPEPEPILFDIQEVDGPKEPPLKDDFFDKATTPIGDGECVVCGAPTFRPPGLTKAGHRKRVPKHCDLHTPNVRIPGERPSFAGVESQLARIQEELADDVRLLGTMAGPLFPVTGYYIFDSADAFTTAILKLAKNNSRVLRVLHRAAQVAPIYTVAQTVAGTAYAVQVDTKKADPYTTISKRLGVNRAYDAIYGTDNVNGDSPSNTTVSPPPRYSTVP